MVGAQCGTIILVRKMRSRTPIRITHAISTLLVELTVEQLRVKPSYSTVPASKALQMNDNKDQIRAIVKTQTTIWLLAIAFATGYALFAKLIWTAKFPILLFLPIFMVGFALASIKGIEAALAQQTRPED